MFGTNRILKPIYTQSDAQKEALDGELLAVHSIFATIQGEGPHAGEPAIFIRLAGCNLRCHFRDTEFETGTIMGVNEIQQRVAALINAGCRTDLVVLTGGEPLRQQVVPLLCALTDNGLYVQIETAGTIWPPATSKGETLQRLIFDEVVQLVCSPKTPKVHSQIEALCEHFKYIIRAEDLSAMDGLPVMSTQREGERAELYRPDRDNVLPTIWVQPMAEYIFDSQANGHFPDEERTKANMQACVNIAKIYGYRISLQQHKILGVE